MRNFAPQSKQFNERKITRRQEEFSAGVFNDIAASKVPINGLFYSDNYNVHPDRLEGRAGCKRWSNTVLPSMVGRTGYSLTKSGTTVTKTVGENFTDADVGNYVVYDDGEHERISEWISTTQVTVEVDDAHAASTSAYIRGPVNCLYHHGAKGRVILHIDTRIFIAADTSISSWTQAYSIGYYDLLSTISVMDERDQYAYVFNSSKTFKINLDSNPVIYYAINSPIPSVLLTETTETSARPYGHKVLYRMARLSGATPDRQMNDPGISIEQVSGPNAVNLDYKDYAEIYSQTPIGDGSTSYGVLTGGTLQAPYDAHAGWSSITDGQFNITIDSVLRNIVCNFTGVTSMNGVASVIESALNLYWSSATCVFSTNHFIITVPDEGSTISHTSAGDGGTDIGSTAMECESGTGTVTTPAFSAPITIGALTVPEDAGESQIMRHWTHYQVFMTMDIGKNGINAITGQANNSELIVWAGDHPIAKAMIASRSSSTVTSTTGVFNERDVGDVLEFEDGTQVTISAYISTTQVTTSTSGAITQQSCAFGGGTITLASQSGTTVSWVSGHQFVSADVGKTIFWSSGQRSYITAYVSGTEVTASPSATIAQTAMTMDPTERNMSLAVQDDQLRTRIAGFSLQNRYWIQLPDCDVGAVVNAFMFCAVRGEHRMYYSQMPEGQQYLAGYYNNVYQLTSFNDTVQHLSEFPDHLVVYCSHSTHGVPINTFDAITIPEVGEVVAILSGQNIIDHNVGLKDFGSVQKIDKSRERLMTSEPALREFNGFQYSDNLAENRIMKKLDKFQAATASAYSRETGYLLWGKDE